MPGKWGGGGEGKVSHQPAQLGKRCRRWLCLRHSQARFAQRLQELNAVFAVQFAEGICLALFAAAATVAVFLLHCVLHKCVTWAVKPASMHTWTKNSAMATDLCCPRLQWNATIEVSDTKGSWETSSSSTADKFTLFSAATYSAATAGWAPIKPASVPRRGLQISETLKFPAQRGVSAPENLNCGQTM